MAHKMKLSFSKTKLSQSKNRGSSFHVAGVARMALGWLWWRARFPHVAVDAAAFCVAGAALGDM